jgi:Predicted phosphoesterase or phosphohydrolase
MSGSIHEAADRVVMDVDYVISDLHFNHRNIIQYCRDEEFAPTRSGTEDMNLTLTALWNQHVSPDETVVFLGDFAWYRDNDSRQMAQQKVDNLWENLNGTKIFIQGDHDHLTPTEAADDIYSVAIHHTDTESESTQTFFASHFPGDTPESLPGKGMPESFQNQYPAEFGDRIQVWRIHGHHHNNWPDTYPLLNPQRQTINCSVELTDYRPLKMEEVVQIVNHNQWVQSL